MLTSVLDGPNLSLDSSKPKSTRDHNTTDTGENLREGFIIQLLDILRIDLHQFYPHLMHDTCMIQRFDYTDIGVGELDVLSGQYNTYFPLWMPLAFNHGFPLVKMPNSPFETEALKH